MWHEINAIIVKIKLLHSGLKGAPLGGSMSSSRDCASVWNSVWNGSWSISPLTCSISLSGVISSSSGRLSSAQGWACFFSEPVQNGSWSILTFNLFNLTQWCYFLIIRQTVICTRLSMFFSEPVQNGSWSILTFNLFNLTKTSLVYLTFNLFNLTQWCAVAAGNGHCHQHESQCNLHDD